MTVASGAATATTGGAGRYALLVLAVGQVVSTGMFGRFGEEELTSGADVSPLVPPAPMFTIWGVVIISSLAWAVAQVRPSTRGESVRDALTAPLAVVFLGFALWLGAASQSQTTAATVAIFAAMAGGCVVAIRTATRNRRSIATWPRLERAILWTALGTYTGWASVAVFVNLATVLQAAGAPNAGAWGTVWQSLVLLAASGVAVAIVRLSNGLIAYSVTAGYAIAGVLISTVSQGFPALAAVAGLGLAGVVAATVATRRDRATTEFSSRR